MDTEYRILRGDGDVGWVWVKGEPIYDDDGSVVRVVGLTREITHRKQREQELEHVEELISFVLEQSNAGIWELDTESNTLSSYPDRCPIFEDEIETIDEYFEQIHPDDVTQVQTATESAIESGNPVSVEFRLTHQVETERAECLIKPVTDDDGAVTQLTGFTREITE